MPSLALGFSGIHPSRAILVADGAKAFATAAARALHDVTLWQDVSKRALSQMRSLTDSFQSAALAGALSAAHVEIPTRRGCLLVCVRCTTGPQRIALRRTVSRLVRSKVSVHVVLLPQMKARPELLRYSCHVKLAGDVLPRERFLESDTALRPNGAPVAAELRATLYGQEVGDGSVPVVLLPSRRLRRRVKMAEINATMQQALRKAREEAAREAGVELPPPSPTPTPTPYWSGTLNRPLLKADAKAEVEQ